MLFRSGNVLGGTVGLAAIWAIVLVFYDIPNGLIILNAETGREPAVSSQQHWLQPSVNLSTLRSLVGLALPLGLVMMLISLNVNIPRYFIEHHLGDRELGIFSALSYLMVAGNIVVSALGQSASPRLAQYYTAGKSKDFQNLLVKTVLIGAMLGGIFILMAAIAGQQILTLLYRAEYAERGDLFLLLMIAAGIGYVASFLGYGMTAAQYFRVQLPLFTVATGISALTCFWLIPSQGLIGAAVAAIVSAIIQTILSLGVIIYAIRKLTKSQPIN